MKSFYIAARPKNRLKEVSELNEFLVSQGLENTLNWSADIINEEIKRPYIDNPESSAEVGDRMMQAANSADIFILLHDQDLVGAFMEYGVARYNAIENPDKLILVVHMGGRDNVFLHRKNIISFESIDLLKDWIVKNF